MRMAVLVSKPEAEPICFFNSSVVLRQSRHRDDGAGTDDAFIEFIAGCADQSRIACRQ